MKVVKLQGKLTKSIRGLVGANVQEKTVTPSTERQVITADSGYSCLSKVVVEAVTSANPAEVATEAEMDALLIDDNVGKIYKFVGTSEKYITNAIYIVEEN